jgi:hypothetical protein
VLLMGGTDGHIMRGEGRGREEGMRGASAWLLDCFPFVRICFWLSLWVEFGRIIWYYKSQAFLCQFLNLNLVS